MTLDTRSGQTYQSLKLFLLLARNSKASFCSESSATQPESSWLSLHGLNLEPLDSQQEPSPKPPQPSHKGAYRREGLVQELEASASLARLCKGFFLVALHARLPRVGYHTVLLPP